MHVVGGNIVGYSGTTSSYTGVVVRNKTVTDYTIDGRIVVDTVNSPNKVIIGSETNHPLQIVTNNTQRVWIDSSGISTSGNLNVSGDVTISGNLSALGTTTQIDTKMYVTSAVSVVNTGTGPALTIRQTGINDIATFFDDNNVAMILKDGGNVGIGTSNPTRRLNVFGTPILNGDNRAILGLMDNTAMNSGVGGGVDFGGIFNIAGSYAEWSGIKGIKENSVNGDYAGALAFMTRQMGFNTAERMRISSTGNVGIGTTSPQRPLHVFSAGISPLRLESSNTNTTALEIYNSTSARTWETAVAGTINLASIPVGSYYIYDQGSGVPRMVINTSGNVGIGTTTPNERLTVVGNISATGKLYGTESANWNSVYSSVNTVSANWNSVYSNVQSNSANWNSVYSNVQSNSANWNSVYASVNPVSGNWNSVYTNVQTNSANYILDGGNSKGSNLLIGTNDNFNLTLETNNTPRLTIINSGNVGIGTPNPARILHTNGTIRFEGLSVYANNSDAITDGLVAGDVYRTSTGELRIVF